MKVVSKKKNGESLYDRLHQPWMLIVIFAVAAAVSLTLTYVHLNNRLTVTTSETRSTAGERKGEYGLVIAVPEGVSFQITFDDLASFTVFQNPVREPLEHRWGDTPQTPRKVTFTSSDSPQTSKVYELYIVGESVQYTLEASAPVTVQAQAQGSSVHAAKQEAFGVFLILGMLLVAVLYTLWISH